MHVLMDFQCDDDMVSFMCRRGVRDVCCEGTLSCLVWMLCLRQVFGYRVVQYTILAYSACILMGLM